MFSRINTIGIFAARAAYLGLSLAMRRCDELERTGKDAALSAGIEQGPRVPFGEPPDKDQKMALLIARGTSVILPSASLYFRGMLMTPER